MEIKQYTDANNHDDGGFSGEDIRKGRHTLLIDVTCKCGKEQSYATYMTNGGCVRCGLKELNN